MAFLEKFLRSKPVIWVLIILPGLWPAWRFWRLLSGDPGVGADPLKAILHRFGLIACVLLAVVLALTPLRVLWPKAKLALALNRHRRLVGVASFAYALLHFATHLLYEGALKLGGTVKPLALTASVDAPRLAKVLTTDVNKPFLLTGLIAFTILFVLTVTSVNALVRRLGGKRWKNLHRLAYVAAALAAYHQSAARKIFPQQVLWIFVPLALLEIARIIRQRQLAAARAKPAPG